MTAIVKIVIGLVIGYLIGIVLGFIAAAVFGFEEAARFIAIGCGILGAVLGPTLLRQAEIGGR